MSKSNSFSTTKKQPVSSPSPLEGIELKTDASEPTADELGRLRDILFGSQSRTLEKRLNDLETDLRSLRQEMADLLQGQIGVLSESTGAQFVKIRREFNEKLDKQGADLRTAQKDLAKRLDRQSVEQSSQLQAVQKQLTDNLENLSADLLRQSRETHKELSDRLDKQDAEQAERTRSLQSDLGQMLTELGLRLRQGSENS